MNYFRELKNGEPEAMQSFHKWATIVWFIAAIPICILLASSIPFLVFISVYAVVTGHWSAWQASRVEVKQKQDADVREVLDEIKK
jgi:hypothetical protein